MVKKDDKPDAFDMVSRAMNAIEGEGKNIVVIKPEIIEPLIRQKIESITIEIVSLQKCICFFEESSEIFNRNPQIQILYQETKYSTGGRSFNGYISSEVGRKIIEIPCIELKKQQRKELLKGGKIFKCKYSWDARFVGDFCELHPNSLSPYQENLHTKLRFGEPTKLTVHTINIGEVRCGGECKQVNIRQYLTGTEITSDQVAARAQEVLKLKIEQRQKLEDMHLRLITGVVERINE